MALVAWLLIELGNDYMHFRYGLLRPQRPRTVFYMLIAAVCFLALRIVHLSLSLPADAYLSTERIQRIVMGIPYFTFRFFGLDMWGFAIGFLAFSFFVSLGFFALCLCSGQQLEDRAPGPGLFQFCGAAERAAGRGERYPDEADRLR